MAVSGVFSSWVTPATNSICWRASRCARWVVTNIIPAVAPSKRQDAEADRQIAPADGGDRLLQGAVAMLDDQLPVSQVPPVVGGRPGGGPPMPK